MCEHQYAAELHVQLQEVIRRRSNVTATLCFADVWTVVLKWTLALKWKPNKQTQMSHFTFVIIKLIVKHACKCTPSPYER